MKKRIPWSGLLAVGAFVALGGLLVKNLYAGPANLVRPSELKAAQREVPTVAGGDDRSPLAPRGFVSGNGIVEPADRETKVAGATAGRVAAIRVSEGETVEQGTVLVELESEPEKAALSAAEADVAVAQETLSRTARGLRTEDVEALAGEAGAARARARMSAEILARTEQLADGGSISPADLDRARRQAEVDASSFHAAEARRQAGQNGSRREDVLIARAQLRAAIAHREQARAALERLTVRAPLSGTVLQIKYRNGEYYNPASANAATADPLVVMGETRAFRVRVDVDERDVAKVKLGAPCYVALSAYPGRRFGGKVVEIGRRMGRKNVRTDDPVERLDVKILEVLLLLDDPGGLVPGIRVTAFVESSS